MKQDKFTRRELLKAGIKTGAKTGIAAGFLAHTAHAETAGNKPAKAEHKTDDKSVPFSIQKLLKAANVEKGSGNPKTERVAEISRDKIREIAEIKMPDLNAYDVESALRIIEGSARSAGLTVVD